MKSSFVILSLVAVLAGCGQAAAARVATDCQTNEAGACLVESAGAPLSRRGQACTRLAPPYATSLGNAFAPFSLPRCDGTPYAFYNQEYCDARVTLALISAGWCQPCRLETAVLEQNFVRRFANCGLRVVQVLVQDSNASEPNQAFCDGWVRQYGLSNPVLRDQNNTIGPLFPPSALPTNLIVDGNGMISYRQNGTSETTMLAQVRAELSRAGAELATCEQN